jgi:hypothetical protein
LRRSDSIRNNFRADQRSLNYRDAKRGIAAASAAGFCARTRPPGTEFLDAETGPQISPPKWVSAHRDKNPGNEWSEIPAETPYLALCRKHAVCKDWMVAQAVGYETVSHVNSLLTGNFTGKTVIFGFGNRPLEPETPLPRHFGAHSLIKLTGKRFRRTGILVAPTGNS